MIEDFLQLTEKTHMKMNRLIELIKINWIFLITLILMITLLALHSEKAEYYWFELTLSLSLIVLISWLVWKNHQQQLMTEDQRQFFDLSLDPFCVTGMDGYFKRINPAFEKAFGFSIRELSAKPLIEFIHPDDRERTFHEIERQARGHKTLAFENRLLHKDGTYRLVSWKSVAHGNLMYAIAQDVTTVALKGLADMPARSDKSKS